MKKLIERNTKDLTQNKIQTCDWNESLIQTALTQYVETQKNLRTIINNYITRAAQKTLQSIYKNGYNSKTYWRIAQQLRQNIVEDIHALKNDDGVRLFSEDEIKYYRHQYSNYNMVQPHRKQNPYIPGK